MTQQINLSTNGEKLYILINTSEYVWHELNIENEASIFTITENELEDYGFKDRDIEEIKSLSIGEMMNDRDFIGCSVIRII